MRNLPPGAKAPGSVAGSLSNSISGSGKHNKKKQMQQQAVIDESTRLISTDAQPAFEGKLLKLCCYISVTILSLTLIIVSALFFVYNAKTDGDSESIFAELPCYTKDPAITSALYTTTMKKIEVDLSKFPNAVCNDGSPAAYYYKPALSNVGHENIWNVHFEGGNWCTDEESCDFRSRLTRYNAKKIADGEDLKDPQSTWYVTSSKLWSDTMDVGGIFAPPPCSPLYGVHQIFVAYCSSDAWMGDMTATNETFGLHFQGANIYDAVVQSVLQIHGLQPAMDKCLVEECEKKPLLLLGGYSAGARGTMLHIDFVRKNLGPAVNVYGVMDSGMWLDIEPEPKAVRSGRLSLKQETINAMAMFKVHKTSILDWKCMDDHEGELWKCMFPQYRMPYVQTPYVVTSSQRDAFMELKLFAEGVQTMPDGVTWVSDSKDRREMHQKISSTFLETIFSLKKLRPDNAFFSAACLDHAVSLDQKYLNWVTTRDFSTTMLTALEKGLDRFGFITYDETCPKPCPARNVENDTLHTDLVFLDTCFPVGAACGGCHAYTHEERKSNTHGESDPRDHSVGYEIVLANYSMGDRR
eukprot:CAMPEP_0198197510 /NCGR_PEP_ID=MMETSP1445-20131203/1105_1 /TAXON_ID=36898 /ORGANISM="Pyramimonas sp., Strain CCMP2087" /LENGTH=580 /DNA_ID=CAMNT_0043866819 /DNA_START=219 /DNA_END=1961 /DNA_ORIENTATION=+